MTTRRPPSFSDTWVAPLLELADTDPHPEVRLAALIAAAHFPLGRTAWAKLVKAGLQLLRGAPGGSPLRRNALSFAARVPLLSVREVLRKMAQDPAEPDRDAIAAALEEVGDPSRIRALLARAEAGAPDAFRLLAMAPLEQTSLTPADIPPTAEAGFWRALAVGRLGDFHALADVFAPDASVPHIFWGSPWSAYEDVAVIRPIPDALSDALHALLSRLDDPELAARTSHDQARALRLTAWAATGSADAEGEPLPPPRPFGPIAAPAPFRTRKAPAGLLRTQVAATQPKHDDGQIAWMIARTPTESLIRETVAVLHEEPSPAARLRLLDILGKTADCQAGSAPTPFRGARGGVAPSGRREVIDDRTKALLRPPAPPPAASAPPSAAPEWAAAGASPPVAFADTGPATPAAAEPAEERRVRAWILHEGRRRATFVAGASNTIRCWIGLPEEDAAATADKTIPAVHLPPEGLPLSVELCWRDQRDHGSMLLPAARTARSGDCDLQLEIPADERYVSAEIMFRYGGRCFEVVTVEAAVLAPGEEEGPRDALRVRVQLSRREVIALDDALPCTSTLVFGAPTASGGSATLQVYDGKGGRNFTLTSPGKAIERLNEMLFSTEKSLVRRRAATPEAEAVLDADDEEVRGLLHKMACFGAGLYNELERQGLADPGDRIQLLSLDPEVILPLEFVYDRGYPVEAARLCERWRDALEVDAKACPVCKTPADSETLRHAPTICPLGFWSLRKVIERLDPDAAAGTSAPQPQRRSLPPIDSAVFASSNKVPEEERRATWTSIHDSVGNATLARHWDEWYAAVKTHPRLLVALPHHDEEGLEDFLEIGDESLGRDLARLGRGQIRPDYVNPGGLEPGPILLLLGCRTGAESELGYVRVIREFQKLKTSIVLGTLGQILGRHAAPLARELVAELAAIDDPEADFGTLMRRVRRRMLAQGYLLSLCLVALGDAEWRLTPRPVRPLPLP